MLKTIISDLKRQFVYVLLYKSVLEISEISQISSLNESFLQQSFEAYKKNILMGLFQNFQCSFLSENFLKRTFIQVGSHFRAKVNCGPFLRVGPFARPSIFSDETLGALISCLFCSSSVPCLLISQRTWEAVNKLGIQKLQPVQEAATRGVLNKSQNSQENTGARVSF